VKKYIIVVDGVVSTRYKYNLWETYVYEDGAVSENARVIHCDELASFIAQINDFLKEQEAKEC
jgi:hypothetical protein